ncbi:Mg-protoporphyrin IX methyl transferase [Stieleria maiorica]|uniref:Mg-protoporphyrin IX methyl transferase n=1 Tax=Stieleria maiorica TaxID=2795974 RepID=A0A5B9MLK2_9BACT|nr:class I SAM-dependent methyltransferase [Stieleria maiorica]QEG00881.1 Mg-protoporphyrin IX methyl transferase [Stieleria maiorica]
MSQPPHSTTPPDWQRPRGVAAGTWQYVHQRTIARHYDDFVADTPLCELDRRYVLETLSTFSHRPSGIESANSGAAKPLVLDLGAGTGRLALPVSRRGYDVLAVDLSHPMLEQLVQNFAPADDDDDQAGTVMPMRANLVQLDAIADSVADHAICMFSTLGMIQGRANRIQCLCHIARTVRPGGGLILHVHRRWAALRETGGWARLLRSRVRSLCSREAEFGDATYAYRGLEKMFMHRFSENEIKSDLKAAGWTVERIDRVGIDGSDLVTSAWDASGLFLVCRR